jgi:NAD(P)-dependent dehydrogenase (short-subunit alcohol dehydrogenase family)
MKNLIVVTGASKGIGRAAANALAEGGWSVIGVARSSPKHFPGMFVETTRIDFQCSCRHRIIASITF